MPHIYKDGIPITRKPGVYSITNLVNGKSYIGCSLSLRGRMKSHRNGLRKGNHENKQLQKVWDKYGEDNFEFTVLENCEPEAIFEREHHWIKSTRSFEKKYGYNIAIGRNHADSTKANWSKTRKGIIPVEATAAAAIANKGKPRSEEIRQAISKGNKGKPKSEAHKAAVKATHWTKGPNAAEIHARIIANRPQTLSEETKKKIGTSGRRGWVLRKKKLQTRKLHTFPFSNPK